MVSRSDTIWIREETQSILDIYDFKEQLGQPGQYGRAVRGVRRDPTPEMPKEVAVKIISKARFLRSERSIGVERVLQTFRDEVDIMSQMDHPNIVKFYEAYEDKESFYVVTELLTGGELYDTISKVKKLDERAAARILRQLFEAVDYMHRVKKVVHCDIKPDNIMFEYDDIERSPVKLIDFGMAKILKPRRYFRQFCGTPYYVAPEVLDSRYNEGADVWSLGVVTFVLLHGFPPFHADKRLYGEEADQQIFSRIRGGFTPQVGRGYGAFFPEAVVVSNMARDLISKLLVKNLADRLTAKEALEHGFLSGEAPTTPLSAGVLESLAKFHSYNRFEVAVLDTMQSVLTDEELFRLSKTFENMDRNKDGTISRQELANALRELEDHLPREQLDLIFENADIDGDGVISYKELMLTNVQRKMKAKEERLLLAFQKLDLNGDGSISVDELRHVVFANQVDRAAAEAIINDADADGNGFINYDEFLDALNTKGNDGADPADPHKRIRMGSVVDSPRPSTQSSNKGCCVVV